MTTSTKIFQSTHMLWPHISTRQFTEHDAPDWLTSKNTVKGSTMDDRWFWEKHVLTLEVGQHVQTDFHYIKRVA